MTNKAIKFIDSAPGLTVNDLQKAIIFYESLLGMINEYSNEAYVVLGRDNANLHLTTNNKEKAAGLGYCTLFIAGVDEIYASVIEQQATIVRAIEDSPYGLRDFVMADPDGNKILIGERKE